MAIYIALNLNVLKYIINVFIGQPKIELLIGLVLTPSFAIACFLISGNKKVTFYYSMALIIVVAIIYSVLIALAAYPGLVYDSLMLYVPNPPIWSSLQTGSILFVIAGFISYLLVASVLSYILTGRRQTSLLLSLPIAYGILSLESIILSLSLLLFFTSTIILTILNYLFVFIFIFLKRKCIGVYLRSLHMRQKTFNFKLKLSVVAIFTAIVPIFILAFYESIAYPPIEWDSLAYGVSYSSSIFLHHGIQLLFGPEIGIQLSGNYPPGTQTAVAFIYTLAGGVYDLYYRLFIFLAGVFTAVITYFMSLKLTHSKEASAISLLGLAVSPLFIFYTIEVDYSMYTALEFVTVFYLSFLYVKENKTGVLVLDALCASFAGLTSYIGLFAVLFVMITIFLKSKSSKTFFKSLSLTLVLLIPEYIFLIRNFILLGNPLYPFFGIGKGLQSIIYQSTKNEIRYNLTSSLNTIFSWVMFVEYELARIGDLVLIGVFGFVVYYVLSRSKIKHSEDRLLILFLLVSFIITLALMYVNGPYFRYSLPFISILALTLGVLYVRIPSRSRKFITVILITVFLLTIPVYMPYVENIKSIRNTNVTSTFGYLDKVYGYDAQAWQWIDNNTPKNAVIGSYEIRTYYINRTVFSLDNPALMPLYTGNLNASEVYSQLEKYNISYIFSVAWASKVSSIAPATYYESSLTHYLGDPNYFKTVYANPMDAVYQVSKERTLPTYNISSYSQIYLNLKDTFRISTLNSTVPWAFFGYLTIQPDYINDNIAISLKDNQNSSIELWNGFIPQSLKTGWWGTYENLYRAPSLPQLGSTNPVLDFKLSNGYFTLVIVDWSSVPILNATISITIIYNK